MSCTDKNMHVRTNSVLSSVMKLDQLQFASFLFSIRDRKSAYCYMKGTEENLHESLTIVIQSSQMTSDRHPDLLVFQALQDCLLRSRGTLSLSFPISFSNAERRFSRLTRLNSVQDADKLIPSLFSSIEYISLQNRNL